MKPSDFITESIGQDADAMHQDHEVQLARQDCYNAAKDAIELHKLLASVTETEGLEGWVSEKLTLAADYLRTVKDHFETEQRAAAHFMLPEFTFESAEAQMNAALNNMCKVCGQTPCNCTHLHENDEFAPSKRAATRIATHQWRRGGEASGTSLKGYVTTTFKHIKSVLGDPMYGPTNDPDDKVTCQWVITFKDGTVATIYDYKTGRTPMGEYRWHIGGRGAAVDYVTHLLGLEPEEMYEGEELEEGWKDWVAGGALAAGLAFGAPAHAQDTNTNAVTSQPAATQSIASRYTTGIDYSSNPYTINAAGKEYKFAGRDAEAPAASIGQTVTVPGALIGIRGLKPVQVTLHPDGKYYIAPVVNESAGGMGAGAFATGPTAGGTFKKTTGVPKKVKNTLRRVSPKIGTGIYK